MGSGFPSKRTGWTAAGGTVGFEAGWTAAGGTDRFEAELTAEGLCDTSKLVSAAYAVRFEDVGTMGLASGVWSDDGWVLDLRGVDGADWECSLNPGAGIGSSSLPSSMIRRRRGVEVRVRLQSLLYISGGTLRLILRFDIGTLIVAPPSVGCLGGVSGPEH